MPIDAAQDAAVTAAADAVLDAAEGIFADAALAGGIIMSFTKCGEMASSSGLHGNTVDFERMLAGMRSLSDVLQANAALRAALEPVASTGVSLCIDRGAFILKRAPSSRSGTAPYAPIRARHVAGGLPTDHPELAGVLSPIAARMPPDTHAVVWDDDMTGHARLARMQAFPGLDGLVARLCPPKRKLTPEGRLAKLPWRLFRYDSIAVLADRYKNIAWMAV